MDAEAAQLLRAMEGHVRMSALEKRKRFRQLGRDSPRLCFRCDARRDDGAAMPSGRFEEVSDEVIVLVLEHLAALPVGPLCGLDLRHAVRATVDNLAALASTCRRMNTVLCVIAPGLRKELVARATTQIAPLGLDVGRWDVGARPYTAQVEAETRSADQLALLRVAVDGMVTHCGMPHCRHYRQTLNRELRRRALPVPRPGMVRSVCDENTLAMAATAAGDVVFLAVRRVIPRDVYPLLSAESREQLEDQRTRTAVDVLIRRPVGAGGAVGHAPSDEASLLLPTLHEEGRYGAVEQLAVDSAGTWVAMRRLLVNDPPDDGAWDQDERPQAEVVLWRAGAETTSCFVEPPPVTGMRGMVHPQSVWWMRRSVAAPGDDTADALVVLWSSAWVHEMGEATPRPEGATYALVTYRVDPPVAHDPDDPDWPEEARVAHIESEAESDCFRGLALMASPSVPGDRVAILVLESVDNVLPAPVRTVYMHDIGDERRRHLDSAAAITPRDAHRAQIVAIGLAPGGDAVVVAHRYPRGVYLEVLERTGGVRSEPVFVSTHVIDITHHVWGGSPDPSVFDDDPRAVGWSDALRQPFSIQFSPCGRFAVVVDQRPRWQLRITNHALVVIDMAMRHVRSGVRARPLASVDDVAPRALQWSARGIWLMARHGALLLWAE